MHESQASTHGQVAITVAEREGTRQGWDQLHKTDIYLENGTLMYARQHTTGRPLLTSESGLYLKSARLKDDWLYCIATKSDGGNN